MKHLSIQSTEDVCKGMTYNERFNEISKSIQLHQEHKLTDFKNSIKKAFESNGK